MGSFCSSCKISDIGGVGGIRDVANSADAAGIIEGGMVAKPEIHNINQFRRHGRQT